LAPRVLKMLTVACALAAALGIVGEVGDQVGAAVAAAGPLHRAAPMPVTVSYGSDPNQMITIYPSQTPGSRLVVMVPGNGFRSISNKEAMSARALQSAGFTVFDANYRGATSMTPAFPNALNDIVSATEYAIAHATAYDSDPRHLTLLGGSAGGHLVAVAAEAMNSVSPGTVSNAVTLSGPFDFALGIAYWSKKKGPVAAMHLNNQLDALGCLSAATCPVALENMWSPDQHITSTNCPAHWLLLNSKREETPVAQADGMTGAIRAANCQVVELIIPGSKHGFHYLADEQAVVTSFIAIN